MKNLWKLYRYLFYKVYFAIRRMHESDNDHFIACNIVTLFFIVNIGSLVTFVNVLMGPSGVVLNRNLEYIGVVLCIAGHYLLFLYGRRYEGIILEFKGESDKANRQGNRTAKWYLSGSLVLFIFLNILKLLIWGK